MDRRTALQVVACLLATDRRGEQPKPAPLTRRVLVNPGHEERLELDFGAGAYAVKEIVVTQGALTARILVSDLMTALGAKATSVK